MWGRLSLRLLSAPVFESVILCTTDNRPRLQAHGASLMVDINFLRLLAKVVAFLRNNLETTRNPPTNESGTLSRPLVYL